MSERSVASRYAKSILDLAIERNCLEKIEADMELVYKTGKASPQFQVLLRNPIIPLGKKLSVIKALFEGKVDPLTLGFLEIMIRKERSDILYPASEEFIRQFKVNKQVLTAEITTAVPLTGSLRNEILDKVKPMYSGKYLGEIQVKEIVDPEIIGGFILRIEDKRFDSSLKRTLSDLKKDLVNTSFVKLI